MWLAIIFLLLLLGGGGVYWFLIRKKPAQKYSCKGTTCTKDAQGTYDSLDECKKKCTKQTPSSGTQKYSCKEDTCTKDPQGKYDSQDACTNACTKQKPSGSNAYCGKAWNNLDCNIPCPNEKAFCTKLGYANCYANSSLTQHGPPQCPPPKPVSYTHLTLPTKA